MKNFTSFLSLVFLLSIISYSALQAQQGVGVGDGAPGFELKNTVDGKIVSLSDYNEKEGVILIFTCNHCPYAKLYEQRIMDLDQKYASQGYPVVAISPNDPNKVPEDGPKEMKKLAKKKGYSFPYLFDETQDIAHAYGATRTPHIYLLKNHDSGNFSVEYIGAIDDSPKNENKVEVKFLEDAIQALKNGETPAKTETKAVGCTIKWKNS